MAYVIAEPRPARVHRLRGLRPRASAIFGLDDLPEKWAHFARRNADFYQRKWPVSRVARVFR